MKILVLTGASDRHYYFINKIVDTLSSGHQIYVVLNSKKASSPKTLRSKVIKKLKRYQRKPRTCYKDLRQFVINLCFYPFLQAVKQEYSLINAHYFEGQSNQYLTKKKRISGIWDAQKDFSGINSANAHKMIKEVNPDLTIVMGTCLISKKTILSCGYVINIHTGLSPYYKGGNSNFWPIYHRYNNLTGYTLHEMTTGIDSGPILSSGIIEAREYNYSYPRVNSIAIIKGIEALCEIISTNSFPASTPQWSGGRCFNNSDFDGYCCLRYIVIKWLLNNMPFIQPINLPDVRAI